MRNRKNINVYEKKPTKTDYILMVLRNLISLAFVRQTCVLFAYYIINYVRGRRLARIGSRCHISPTVLMRYPERIIIGNECLLNHNNVLQAGKKEAVIKLGDYVMCGPNVQMFAYNHSVDLIDTPMIKQPYTEGDIIIEDNVWIGAGSIILAGAKINSGVVVAAGSVVDSELPANAICGGVPAKVIKPRE